MHVCKSSFYYNTSNSIRVVRRNSVHLPLQKYSKSACHELLGYVRRAPNITLRILSLHLPEDRCGIQSGCGTCQAPFVIYHLLSEMKIQHLQRPKSLLQP